ncbi:hypothetical protein [Nocardia sp. XZ_19_385]|uniref:hypothetical protein n=1 Tax=Nocardia sp. XZ_19_385 TaxID=2769488 RepID=UPI00188FB326|nr:hypothetical protein [Nocardia sp. XZ_19_385]
MSEDSYLELPALTIEEVTGADDVGVWVALGDSYTAGVFAVSPRDTSVVVHWGDHVTAPVPIDSGQPLEITVPRDVIEPGTPVSVSYSVTGSSGSVIGKSPEITYVPKVTNAKGPAPAQWQPRS